MADEDQDKSLPATQHKLEDARGRGEVARSPDFTAFCMLAALLIALFGWGLAMARQGGVLGRRVFARAGEPVDTVPTTLALAGDILDAVASMAVPFGAAAVAAAILANLVQNGFVFSADPLKPQLSRIHPANGFKRIFSRRSVYEVVKMLLKFAVLGTIAVAAIVAALPRLLHTASVDPRVFTALSLDQITSLLFKLLMGLALFALADLMYVRQEFARRMRMSHRDMREETKRREGDPAIRSRLRELRRELAKRSQSVKRIPEADVLITNPDHYAVALRYERHRMAAPVVIAKGTGDFAQLLKRTALTAGVPLYEDRPLARRLFAEAALDQPLQDKLFESVARVYAWLYSAHAAGRRVEMHL